MSRIDSPFYKPGPSAGSSPPSHQPFTTLNKELQIRQRILSIYNKELEDFDSKTDYDDYLEEREDIMFNLSQGIDVKAMEAKVKAYQVREGESIAKNEARRLQRVLGTGGDNNDLVGRGDVAQNMVDRVDDGTVKMMDPAEVDVLLQKQTKEEWERMAASSGWKRVFYEAQCQALYAT